MATNWKNETKTREELAEEFGSTWTILRVHGDED